MSFSFLENYNQDTLIVLGFAVLLLLFLLILIIVTINVLKGDNSAKKAAKKAKKAAKNGETSEGEGSAESEEAKAEEEEEEEEEPAEEEVELTDEEIEDETSRMVQEAVAAVEATKAKIEAERKEREAAEEAMKRNASKASEDEDDYDGDEELATEDDFEAEDNDDEEDEEPDMLLGDVEDDDDYDDEDYDDEVDEPTGELDTVRIREALKKAQQESRDTEQDAKSVEFARERAEAPEYDASFDSAFVSKPSLEEDKPEPVIPNPTVESMKINVEEEAAEAVSDAIDAADTGAEVVEETAEDAAAEAVAETAAEVTAAAVAVEAAETEAPKKKKKKSGKKPLVKPASAPTGEDGKPKYFWYNTQDTDGLEKKEDMFYYCHYFADPDSAVIPLITEMYDCGFVRTEEIMRIAYGVDFQAFDMGDILDSDDGGFDMSKARKQPTEEDRREIYKLWKRYVNKFHKIIVINSQDDVEEYIIRKMYAYGKKDAKELLYSPM